MNRTALIMTLNQLYRTLQTASEEQKSQACRALHANAEMFLKKVPDRCFLQIAKSWEEALKEAVEQLVQETGNISIEERKSGGYTEAIGIRSADFRMEHIDNYGQGTGVAAEK